MDVIVRCSAREVFVVGSSYFTFDLSWSYLNWGSLASQVPVGQRPYFLLLIHNFPISEVVIGAKNELIIIAWVEAKV